MREALIALAGMTKITILPQQHLKKYLYTFVVKAKSFWMYILFDYLT